MDPYSTTPQGDADDTQMPAAPTDEPQAEGVELPEVDAPTEMGEPTTDMGSSDEAPAEPAAPAMEEAAPEASSDSVEAAPAEAAEESDVDAAA